VGELLKFEQNAYEELSSLRLGYTESLGNLELRTQIASLYEKISPGQILVHSGAEEAIFNFMNVALDAGDHIIVQAPYYQSLGEVARSIGVHVTEWKGDPDCDWELDLQFLKKNVTDRTKVVEVNFPHNPTGYLPDSGFLRELSVLSDKWGFIVFSDEVYRGLEYEPTECLPAFSDISGRGISLGVMSKSYGLAGLRIGWVATRNKELFDALAAFKDYTTICNSAPSEYLAALALRHRRAIIERNLRIIRGNLSLLASFFSRHQDLFVWHEPKAGPIAFPRYLGGPVEQFCSELVRSAGVLLLPGTLFGDGYDCFRIGFGRSSLAACLPKMEAFLKMYTV
jgi:aspartate/methionine/tyrosine aminotransferase